MYTQALPYRRAHTQTQSALAHTQRENIFGGRASGGERDGRDNFRCSQPEEYNQSVDCKITVTVRLLTIQPTCCLVVSVDGHLDS